MTNFITFINELLWGSVLIYLIFGAGLWFTFYCGFVQFRYFRHLRFLLRGEASPDKSGISPFQALCTGLAARSGSGNLAGVALAITAGGPGAIFWMWVAALIGMATSFAECSLAQLYKSRDSAGNYHGGPAWYIERGLGMRWPAVIFAILIILTSSVIFNAVQANSIAIAMQYAFAIPKIWVGIALMALTGGAIWGGMQRIAHLSQWLVPLMALLWVAVGLYAIATHIQRMPEVIRLIFNHAFGWYEAASGVMGYTISQAIINGFQRSILSNEAGTGSTPNAAAAAAVWPPHPVTQGIVQMFGVLIDTVIICTATAAIILLSGMLDTPDSTYDGIILVQQALSSIVGDWGRGFTALILFLFAFTSISVNCVYAENNLRFLKQNSPLAITAIRCLVLVMLMLGSLAALPLVWQLANIAVALLAMTNISAILLLSPVVKDITADYLRQRKLGITPVFDPNRFPEIKTQLAPGVWDKTEQK